MYVLEVENRKGEVLTLSQNESNYQIIRIEGLNPPPAILNNSAVAGLDGTKFNSAKLSERNMVITLKINGDIEKNRTLLYQYFGTKQWCKLYYTNGVKDVHIEGYVETIECDLFTMHETMQISIICNNPYLKSAFEVFDDISKVLDLFEFPFAIDAKGIEFSSIDSARVVNVRNEGESVTGVVIEMVASGHVEKLVIRNIITGESFGIDFHFEEGDQVVIDTNPGYKSITFIRDGVAVNIFNKIRRGSDWLALQVGDNFFTYDSEQGAENMRVIFKHYYMYEGV